MKLKKRKLVCLALCAIMAFPMSITANSIDDIKKQQEDLRNEKSSLEEQLQKLEQDSASAEEYQEVLVKKINVVTDRIDSANVNIDALNKSIVELEGKLEEAAKEYKDTLDALKQRIIAIYKAGETSTLEILLNSQSLYDFTVRTTALSLIAEHDQKLVDEITVYIDATKEDRLALNKEKEQVALLKKQLESDKNEVEVLMTENKELLAQIAVSRGETEEEIHSLTKEDAELTAEIERLIEEERKRQEEEEKKRQEEEEKKKQEEAENNKPTTTPDTSKPETSEPEPSTPNVGSGDVDLNGDFNAVWPTPGYGTWWITQHYASGRHYGIDIGAPYGSPIVAVEDGKVLEAYEAWDWGINALIYHNDTYTTRYAHMSVMLVSPGDYVKQGQVIGYVGSTGHSTGPHLHFEVYQNGTRVNPYPFIT